MTELIRKLRENAYIKELHGLAMTVKDIPDPIENTVLDPRVFADRKAELMRAAAMPESTDELVRWMCGEPAYPNRDVTTVEITKKEETIVTGNGSTKLFLYRPKGGAGIKPAMLFFHGGAFIAGCTAVVENFCRLLAEKADMVVVGVDYALAPEHKFPAGLCDCYDAFEWVYDHAAELSVDDKRLCVGGDSAGGTLAVGCSLMERDRAARGEISKCRIRYQALIYPAVIVNNVRTEDFRWRLSEYGIPDEDSLAMGAATSLKATSEAMAEWYMGREEKVTDPLAAPLFQESLRGLPKTLMAICEFDYLRLSAEAFGRKMTADEVDHRTILYRGMDHSFIDKVGDCPQAYDVALEIADDIYSLSSSSE